MSLQILKNVPRGATVIVLDNTEFVRGNYTQSRQLITLFTLSRTDKILLAITDIVLREAKSNIEKEVDAAIKCIDGMVADLSRKHKVSKLTDLFSRSSKFGSELSKKDYISHSLEKFDNELIKAKVRIINTETVPIAEVTKMYFGKEPPFGEGKKKNEFPDAISYLGIVNQAKKEGWEAVFLTQDSDFKIDSEHFKIFSSYQDMYDEHLIEGVIGTAYDDFDTQLQEFKDAISDTIDEFMQSDGQYLIHDFAKNLSYVESPTTDVVHTKLSEVSAEGINFIDDKARLEITADIEATVFVVYHDMNTEYIDNEDDVVSHAEQVEDTWVLNLQCIVDVIADHQLGKFSDIVVEKMTVELIEMTRT